MRTKGVEARPISSKDQIANLDKITTVRIAKSKSGRIPKIRNRKGGFVL
jgi:hypothetical protein